MDIRNENIILWIHWRIAVIQSFSSIKGWIVNVLKQMIVVLKRWVNFLIVYLENEYKI